MKSLNIYIYIYNTDIEKVISRLRMENPARVILLDRTIGKIHCPTKRKQR